MKLRKSAGIFLSFLFMLAVTLPLFTPAARADDLHRTTVLTFKRPIQLPGNRVLPPGTYRFRLFDPENDLQVIAIYDLARPHIEALLDTRASFRAYPGGAELTLARQPQGAPDVLLRCFFPGHEFGYDLMYSRRMQKRLDREQKITVLVPSGYVE